MVNIILYSSVRASLTMGVYLKARVFTRRKANFLAFVG